jgi:glycosyltransferase involved in cell wall biosynthesis
VRVGIVIHRVPADSGGGYASFQATVADALQNIESKHRLFRLNLGERADAHHRSATDIDLRDRYGKDVSRQAMIESAITDFNLDVVWFLNPNAVCLSVPFFATVWDLQHRLQPYFPELNRGDWTWHDRESTYLETLRRATRILTGTQVGKEEIIRFYGVYPGNVRVVPLPVPKFVTGALPSDTIDIRTKYRLPETYLIYPAQFWPHKNHVNLLLALEILKMRRSLSIALVLTGSDQGNRYYIEEFIRQKGLINQVYILGIVPQKDLIALYLDATALVYPTFFGPDNLPPLEAFALGCPVIASRICGAKEQLGDAALLFDPASPDELASALASLCEEPSLRASLVKRGLQQVSGRSGEDYVRRVCEILTEFEAIRRTWRNDYPRLDAAHVSGGAPKS